MRSPEELAGPLWDLEALAVVLDLKPRSIHQAIARGRMERPGQRTARGALAWNVNEARAVVTDRVVRAVVRPRLWQRLEVGEQESLMAHARAIAVLVLTASRR